MQLSLLVVFATPPPPGPALANRGVFSRLADQPFSTDTCTSTLGVVGSNALLGVVLILLFALMISILLAHVVLFYIFASGVPAVSASRLLRTAYETVTLPVFCALRLPK